VRLNFVGDPSVFKLLLGIFASVVCFACAALLSSLLSRTKLAAIAGLFAGLSISGLIVHCWIRLDLVDFNDVGTLVPGELAWILCVLALSSVLILPATLFLSSSSRRRTGIAVLIGPSIIAGSAAVAFFAFAYPHRFRL
jgi:hypothetical protein